jgi:site-specific DNA recombinase
MTTPSAAAIYARISSDPEGDRLGVSRQLADCQALAERKGWTVAERYVDDDRSAYRGNARPEYRRLLADIASGTIDAVLVYNLDRLHRQPKELEEFFDICDDARVSSLASVEGDIDLASHEGRFHARIIGAVSRKSSDDMSRRIRRKHLELAQAGQPGGGGTRPYGYRPDRLTAVPAEAAVIRDAAGRILAGDSLRAVATDLNARGIATVRGGPWSVQVLRRMLMSIRLSGQRGFHGEIVAQGTWQAILTPDETGRLRALLGNPERLTRRTVRSYLLGSGLLRCGLCETPLVARPRADGQRRYVCAKGPGLPGCGRIAILAESIEHLIEAAVFLRLDSPALAGMIAGRTRQDASATEIRQRIDADTEQLAELATFWGEQFISTQEYVAARKPILRRLTSDKRELGRLLSTAAFDRYVGSATVLRDAWPEMPISRRHAVVAAILDHARVASAVRGRAAFDPARVTPLWRV